VGELALPQTYALALVTVATASSERSPSLSTTAFIVTSSSFESSNSWCALNSSVYTVDFVVGELPSTVYLISPG